MGGVAARDGLAVGLLRLGVAVPLIYYGIQAAAAPFFPKFSFVGTSASELGSDLSRHAWVFNAGIMTQGVVTLLAAAGFFLALRRLNAHWLLTALVTLSIAVNAVHTLWAAAFPMPDPRHGGHPAFVLNLIALPLLLAAALWPRTRSRPLKAYLLATLALLAVMIPVMRGDTGLDTHTYRGLVQRVFTLTVFPPIAVAAYVLSRRLLEATPPAPSFVQGHAAHAGSAPLSTHGAL